MSSPMRENKGRWSVTFTGATVTATLLLGLVMTTAPAQARTPDGDNHARVSTPARTSAVAGTRVSARWTGAVNTSSLSAVNAAYWSRYAPKLWLPIDWLGGSLLACLPGLTSLLSNNATLSSLNYVRSLAGLAPVAFSSSLNSSAQKAALIMAANESLDHHPGSGWKCWSKAGATAASRSNLALAWPQLNSGEIISLYMDDKGGTNIAAGHRRWILNPFSTVMGSGSTRISNALTVIGPSSAARPNPRWVGWPSAGYFPNPLEPSGRWSLSSGLRSVSFAHAKVNVFRNGVRVPVHKYPVENGYAQPTVVWQMPAGFSKTSGYHVVVTGIRKAGSRKALRASYSVRLFAPTR
jgi:uncharacterized protein YkwD